MGLGDKPDFIALTNLIESIGWLSIGGILEQHRSQKSVVCGMVLSNIYFEQKSWWNPKNTLPETNSQSTWKIDPLEKIGDSELGNPWIFRGELFVLGFWYLEKKERITMIFYLG